MSMHETQASIFESKKEEYITSICSFLELHYLSAIHTLRERVLTLSAFNGSTVNQVSSQSSYSGPFYSISICAQLLLDFNSGLATLTFYHPDDLLPLYHQALSKTILQTSGIPISIIPLAISKKLRIRIEYLPPILELRKKSISSIRSIDAKKLIQVSGTVVRTGIVTMQEKSREYECLNVKCGHRFQAQSDPEQGNIFIIPSICPSPGINGKMCRSTNFQVIENSTQVSDHQVIKIQEQASKLGIGSIPRSIMVVLEDDLVDSVKSGDHIVVVGIPRSCWKPCIKGVRVELETLLYANSIRQQSANTNEASAHAKDEWIKEFQALYQNSTHALRIRNKIIQSICPKVYGMFLVKLAVLLTVVGGCSRQDATGMKTRGQPHLLLIGDPGTGKSQFLRFTAQLSQRSVLTTGIGTTSAGLTCTAVKDHGEWMLEAGALVLADQGICCIDEFSSIRNHDRTSIHEAMEQQTLSVAKAGLVCKLNTRTTIFAVTNPKGMYDPMKDVSVNTAISSPLLSRFDLILVLVDRRNASWDEAVSSFILNGACGYELEANEIVTGSSLEMPTWSIAKLQSFILYIKSNFQPDLSNSAQLILQKYYQKRRNPSNGIRSAARTTIRLLESLTRIAQAHARIMCHQEVQVMDAIVAVYLMEVSQSSDSFDGGSVLGLHSLEAVLQSDFAEDPLQEYKVQENLVLSALGLTNLAAMAPQQVPSQQSSSQVYNSHSSNFLLTQENKRLRTNYGVTSAHDKSTVLEEQTANLESKATDADEMSITNINTHQSQSGSALKLNFGRWSQPKDGGASSLTSKWR